MDCPRRRKRHQWLQVPQVAHSKFESSLIRRPKNLSQSGPCQNEFRKIAWSFFRIEIPRDSKFPEVKECSCAGQKSPFHAKFASSSEWRGYVFHPTRSLSRSLSR